MVSYALAQTKKQNAVIKINKQPPVSTRLRDWPDVEVNRKELTAFLQKLYTSNPHLYRPKADVWGEIKNRFDQAPAKSGRPNVARFDDQVSPRRSASDSTKSSVQDRPDNKTTTLQDAPVESRRDRGSVSTRVRRETGVPASLIPKPPRDAE